MNYGKLRLWALYVIFNMVGFGFLGLAFMNGWVGLVIKRDVSRISIVIAGLFVFGLVLCFVRIIQLNRAFDDLAAERGEWLSRYRKIAQTSTSNATEALKVVLGRKLMAINALLFVLPALGLLGTVVGITMGLEGNLIENAGAISEVVEELFFQIISGLSVAFYTTIVGMVFMLWTYPNLKILEMESMRLMEHILVAGLDDSLKVSEENANPQPKERG